MSRLSEIHMKHGTSHKRETKGCVHLSAQQSGSLPRRCQALLTVGTRHRRWGQPTKPRRSSEPAELIVGSHVKKATSKGDAILYASSTTRSLESAAFFFMEANSELSCSGTQAWRRAKRIDSRLCSSRMEEVDGQRRQNSIAAIPLQLVKGFDSLLHSLDAVDREKGHEATREKKKNHSQVQQFAAA